MFPPILPKRLGRCAASVGAVVALVLGAGAGNVGAARSPCGSSGNYFDGAWALNTDQYGASANIQPFNPAICGSSSFGAAWSMETGNAASDGYAQAGYGNFQGSYVVFSQWTVLYSGPYHTKYFAAPSGTAQYWVSYNFSNGHLYMNKGVTTLDQTTFDPAVSWTGPWIPEFFGETKHCESDVPGVAGNRVAYTSVQKMARDGTWSSISSLSLPSPNCTSSRYHRNWSVQPTSFQIYTDPL
jgi:hypothetical protein